MTQSASLPRRLAARLFGWGIQAAAHIVTAVRADWHGCEPVDNQRVYFANHTSNADLPMIWAVLPPNIRRHVRPVAAADYWLKNKLRAFIGIDVLNGVLIDRRPEARKEGENPMQDILDALAAGSSLIIFPEGLRNMTEEKLMPLKAGIYNMGAAMPDLELVPVWIENLNKIMPKGEVIPVPLICTVTFGTPLFVGPDEDKDAFLARARDALLATDPDARRPSRTLPREGAET
jgi:1-acyl-sn-glycerol-3-phosphate acyltransferase